MDNEELNLWIMDHCDNEEHEIEGGKCIPYIGWFWRTVDFESGSVPIGNCGSFIGFMENNKWDYPERLMTDAELSIVVGYIGDAIRNPDRKWELVKSLWDYMQTLTIDFVESDPPNTVMSRTEKPSNPSITDLPKTEP